MHKLPVTEIIYIESLDEYVKVHVKGKFLITRESISMLEEKLPSNLFVRIHRSFLISTKSVTSVGSDGVTIDGKILPFGRAFKQAALANLKIKV
jgi:DNA-binding LytR/AlgR family response regulator